jgi:hypothetical protein
MFTAQWLRDAAERIVMTFVAAFLAALGPLDWANITDLSVWQAAGAAGLVAAVTAVKTIVAAAVSGTLSPASLVKDAE